MKSQESFINSYNTLAAIVMYVTIFTKANIAMDDVLNRDLGFCALGLGEGVYFPECLEGLVKTNLLIKEGPPHIFCNQYQTIDRFGRRGP